MAGISCMDEAAPASKKTKIYYLQLVSEADSTAKQFCNAVEQQKAEKELQQLFRKARLAYKRTEFLTEYYNPLTAKSLNGAPIPETDADDQHRTTPPEGFQVIEGLIFPKYDQQNAADLLAESKRLVSNFKRLRMITETRSFADEQVFDAMRLEVFRIVTLGISGFDSPVNQQSVAEAASALSPLKQVLGFYSADLKAKDAATYHKSVQVLNNAIGYLKNNNRFIEFDRMAFITRFANPLSGLIVQSAKSIGLDEFKDLRLLKASAGSLFDQDAFDQNYFTSGFDAHTSKEKEELGKLLFFDPVLSGNLNRSCSSCHNPQKAFTDGLAKSRTFDGKSFVQRNTPTVLNAGLQGSLFYDVRVAYLEDQAADVINSREEMHGSLNEAVKRLRNNKEYTGLFKKAFSKADTAVTEYHLKNAIGSYIRSLTSLNAPFDQYVRGDRSKLNADEVKGFNLYMGKGKCGTCHFMPLFNGTVPPNYERTETEIIGVPVSATLNQVDKDPGRFNLRKIALHKHAFRTPTVRNIALTAPYMHNGIYKTLDEVMEFYNNGGGTGLGLNLENQTLPFDKLDLTKKEITQIIAFLNTLTDTTAAKNVPVQLPEMRIVKAVRY